MKYDVQIPPTEWEVAEICVAENSTGKSNVVSRLAFQRDILQGTLACLDKEIERLRAYLTAERNRHRDKTTDEMADEDLACKPWSDRKQDAEAAYNAATNRMRNGDHESTK